MNFADAIRQAAQHAGGTLSIPEPALAPEVTVMENPEWTAEPIQPKATQPTFEPAAIDALTAEPIRVPDPPQVPVANGSIVRLELFLSPEQLNGLFRAVAANQHSVMTLREAATYLRVSPSTLEEMAHEGQIPSLLIDGRWRFTRSAVDEWMSLQSVRQEMAS